MKKFLCGMMFAQFALIGAMEQVDNNSTSDDKAGNTILQQESNVQSAKREDAVALMVMQMSLALEGLFNSGMKDVMQIDRNIMSRWIDVCNYETNLTTDQRDAVLNFMDAAIGRLHASRTIPSYFAPADGDGSSVEHYLLRFARIVDSL